MMLIYFYSLATKSLNVFLESMPREVECWLFLKNDQKYKIFQEYSIFIEKLYESTYNCWNYNQQQEIFYYFSRPNRKLANSTQSKQFSQFLELFTKLISTLSSIYPELILVGDTNLDVLKYNACSQTYLYIDTLFANRFLQTVTKPARCYFSSATGIDHVLTNAIVPSYDTCIITNCISNLFPLIFF